MGRDVKLSKKGKKQGFHNTPGDIVELKVRDWYGHTFYRNQVNTADKKAFATSLRTVAEFGGLNIEVQEDLNKLKEKVKKSIEKDRERVKEFLSKDR